MTYKEARAYLEEIAKQGSILGLASIRNLLYYLGNPQDKLRFIHIAGTNGKGSVLAYTASILKEAGFRVGKYISPTVQGYLERIQIGDTWISEASFAGLTEKVQRTIMQMEKDGYDLPTIFEVETAMAFLYFAEQKCDIAVLETGLGGALDATNIVEHTVVAAFAHISRDHMGFLGDTLEKIAEQKAGIIKSDCEVVTARQDAEVLHVLQMRAEEAGCRVWQARPDQAEVLEESYEGQSFRYPCVSVKGEKKQKDLHISLAGRHQIENAIVSCEIINALNARGYCIGEDAVAKGLASTKWVGRFTCLSRNPIIIVDGAHNEDAAQRLRESADRYFSGKRIFLIMGVFKDKEYDKIAKIMAPVAYKIYTVELPDEGRTLDSQILKHALEPYCERVDAVGNIKRAVEAALKEAGKEDVILAFGSLSYLGKVMEFIERGTKHEP